MSEEMNFDSLNMKINYIIKRYDIELQRELFQYMSEMDELNKQAYNIAYEHLGTSFSIAGSNGFKQWLANKKTK
jgi:hypothetical protein